MFERVRFGFRSWWWVATFCLLSLFAYFEVIQVKKAALSQLTLKKQEMEKEKIASQEFKEELLLAVSSKDDPAWIEMILMRDLGVVPEGWLKVHFKR
jgi:hypothetical protein